MGCHCLLRSSILLLFILLNITEVMFLSSAPLKIIQSMGLQRVRYDWAINILRGFPGTWDSKESACNAGDVGSIPGWGRSPGEGKGNQLQYSCLENSTDKYVWWATVHGVTKESDNDWAINVSFFFNLIWGNHWVSFQQMRSHWIKMVGFSQASGACCKNFQLAETSYLGLEDRKMKTEIRWSEAVVLER